MKTAVQTFSAALLGLAATGACSQGFSLEGAVIDSRSGISLGVVTERGDLASLFRAQKAMTFGILRSAGISLDQLSPDVRARIERFQTTNVEAFRAFSQGLDLKDQGKFAEAREFFKRAAELDPGFALAAEQQQSMPDINLGANVQTRAVLLAAAGAAVDRGKAAFVVDLARAVAAIQAGASVITVPAPADQTRTASASDFTANPPGSGSSYTANQVVALSYSYPLGSGTSFSLTNPNEYLATNVSAPGGLLQSVRSAQSSGFVAQRLAAASAGTGNFPLPDGTIAYWGSWLSAPGASAAITTSGQTYSAPALGPVDYVLAEAPRAMPTTGTAVFSSAGGPMGTVTGTIAVNFVNRNVAVQNLALRIGTLNFSGLNGSGSYDAAIASGAFSGRYTSGSCAGCTAFNPLSSLYSGNFVGRDAHGLVFSTLLITGGGTASGVQLFTRP